MLLSKPDLAELELRLGRKPTSALETDEFDLVVLAYRPLFPDALRGQGEEAPSRGDVHVWVLNAFTRDRLERDLGRPLPKMSDSSARTLQGVREELVKNGPQTMTNLTELVWGTSGRGNKSLVELIRAFALLGLVKLQRSGRAQWVSL